jgi:dsDNA-specific endonuclease/ATPase MutS2
MRSCPLNPWSIGPSGPESYTWLVGWHDHSLDLIELSTADVTEILCGKRTATGGHETSALVVSHSDIKKRKRGSPPKKFEETKRAMSDHLRQGQETVDGLRRMLEKELKLRYGVSRDAARKARNEVLSEFVDADSTRQCIGI